MRSVVQLGHIWANRYEQLSGLVVKCPHVQTVNSCFCVRPLSVGGQTDAAGGRQRRGAAGAVPAQHPARPQPAAPDGVHARAAVPSGAGVREGELRLQAPAVRAGHRAQLTGDNNKGIACNVIKGTC